LPSLFEARRRLPTSATTATCGQPNPSSGSSQGRRPRPPSFSDVRRSLPCGSGCTRRAALRPLVKAPVLVVLACASFPNRDAASSASPPKLALAVHSEDRRARVEGPSEGRVPRVHATISRACLGCMRFVAHADGVPLLGVLRTSAVIGASASSGGYRCLHHGPTEAFVPTPPREEWRLPEDQDAFHRHGREGVVAKGLLPPAFAPALSLTPPTLFPQGGDSALDGHCKVTVRSPAGP
jgi:hypothetical protein